MRRRFVAIVLAALLMATFLSELRPTHAQDAAQSFRFVPAEAIAAVVAYPKRTLDAPGTELYPKEVITAWGLQELGIDPLDIEQLVAFVESPN